MFHHHWQRLKRLLKYLQSLLCHYVSKQNLHRSVKFQFQIIKNRSIQKRVYRLKDVDKVKRDRKRELAFKVIELVEELSRLLDKAGLLVLIAGELDFAPSRFYKVVEKI